MDGVAEEQDGKAGACGGKGASHRRADADRRKQRERPEGVAQRDAEAGGEVQAHDGQPRGPDEQGGEAQGELARFLPDMFHLQGPFVERITEVL